MALTGHLSDLSLSELIEFFCNQRKTGQLKVLYPQGPGYFCLQSGSVVDARIGVLRGIEAVYFALTLPNAEFEFGNVSEPLDRNINQPWTQVVLEGLRRLDEGIVPATAFPPDYHDENEAPSTDQPPAIEIEELRVPSFLSLKGLESRDRRTFAIAGAVVVSILGSIVAIGIPAGWYGRAKAASGASQPATSAAVAEPASAANATSEPTEPALGDHPAEHPDEAAAAARRQREREKAKAREEKAALTQPASNSSAPAPGSGASEASQSGPRKVTVTVTYDESGRVTQASGGDASAVRIARQKRFPAGKAGTATVTIPINWK